jgi:hypothetical protein
MSLSDEFFDVAATAHEQLKGGMWDHSPLKEEIFQVAKALADISRKIDEEDARAMAAMACGK